MTLSITVVGGGLAGAALVWRLAGRPGVDVTLVPGADTRPDATAVSGGVVRAYDRDERQRELALESLLELQADARLADWAGYRSGVFTYLLDGDPDDELALAVKEIDRVRPGTIELTDAPNWVAHRAAALVESGAGRIDPDRLRHRLLAEAAHRIRIAPGPVTEVGPGWVDGPAGRQESDIVVLATGAGTPALLRASAPGTTPAWRTRVIRYAVHPCVGVDGRRPTGFVDERTGLYGTPLDDGLLLGLPTDEWAAAPSATTDPATDHHDRAAAHAAALFTGITLGPRRRTAAAADCYPTGAEAPVLDLRPVPGTGHRLTTFTGGSGGAAKTVLSASARAATRLAEL